MSNFYDRRDDVISNHHHQQHQLHAFPLQRRLGGSGIETRTTNKHQHHHYHQTTGWIWGLNRSILVLSPAWSLRILSLRAISLHFYRQPPTQCLFRVTTRCTEQQFRRQFVHFFFSTLTSCDNHQVTNLGNKMIIVFHSPDRIFFNFTLDISKYYVHAKPNPINTKCTWLNLWRWAIPGRDKNG